MAGCVTPTWPKWGPWLRTWTTGFDTFKPLGTPQKGVKRGSKGGIQGWPLLGPLLGPPPDPLGDPLTSHDP